MAAYTLRGGRWTGAAAILAAWGASLAAAPAADAATIRVDTRADGLAGDAACTLREAVVSANFDDDGGLGCEAGDGDDAIILGGGTYRLTSAPVDSAGNPNLDMFRGDLHVADADGDRLDIAAFSAATIDASPIADRVILASSPLKLTNLTITGGDAEGVFEHPGLGGGVATDPVTAPKLTLRRTTVHDNTADARGGGIHAAGELSILNSTVSGNAVNGAGPGGGGISVAGDAEIERTTIAANTVAGGSGGGLLYEAALDLEGSILADNSAGGGGSECSGPASASGGFNVVESTAASCGLAAAPSDVIADPGLAPLADNGGPTMTHAFERGGPPQDIGPAASGAVCRALVDQRGLPRGTPRNGACDAGAYELSFCVFTPANVIGTSAADVLTAPNGRASVLGLDGDDVIIGGPADDSLCGEGGRDLLAGGPGADLLEGGPGIDIASYAGIGVPLSLTLDGRPNDGRAGEGDFIATESVIGGSGPDVIAGDGGANGVTAGAGADTIDGHGDADSLLGGDGADTIDGGDGADIIRGGSGNDAVSGAGGADLIRGDGGADRLDGAAGNDRVLGGNGKDKLLGGVGFDLLEGGRGADKVLGGEGRDRIQVRGGGRDVVRCGRGRDRVTADRRDKVARDCEKVKRR